MAHNCESCKFRAHYDKKPQSFLGKFWRWQKKAELREKYNFTKY